MSPPLTTFGHAALGCAFAVSLLAAAFAQTPPAQSPPPQQDDPRILHYAVALDLQRALRQCRVGATQVTPGQLEQKVAQLAQAIGPAAAKEIRDELAKEPVECPQAADLEGFREMLTLVVTKSSEEVAKELAPPEEPPAAPQQPPPRR